MKQFESTFMGGKGAGDDDENQDRVVAQLKRAPTIQEREINEKYLLPYLGVEERRLRETMLSLEAKLKHTIAAAETGTIGPAYFMQGLFDQEIFRRLKMDQYDYVENHLPKGMTVASAPPETIEALRADFPNQTELESRQDDCIAKYRQAIRSIWEMKPSPNTKVDQYTAQTHLADMLYRKASGPVSVAEKKALQEEADVLYLRAIESPFLDDGQKDELRLIAILRQTNKTFSPKTEILVEHGTPREDLRGDKADLKIYHGAFIYPVQLKTLTPNDYVTEYNAALVAKAKRYAPGSTAVIQISTDTLRRAYRDFGRITAKKLIAEFVTGLRAAGATDFTEATLIPPVEIKDKTKKKVNRRTVETDVQKYANMGVLRKFGITVEPTAAGITSGKAQLTEAIVAMLEDGEIKFTKEDIANPSTEIVSAIKNHLLQLAA